MLEKAHQNNLQAPNTETNMVNTLDEHDWVQNTSIVTAASVSLSGWKARREVRLARGAVLEMGQQRLHLFPRDQSVMLTGVMIYIPLHVVQNLCIRMTSLWMHVFVRAFE